MTKRQTLRRASAIAFLVTTLIAGCGEDPRQLVASAKEYLSKNDSNAAVIQLRNALQQDPNLAEARFLLGKVLLETGDAAGAEKELRKALDLLYSPEDVVPPLARSLVLLGRHRDVITEFAGRQMATPKAIAELATALGQSHLALRNVKAARNAFNLAVAFEPKYVPAHLGRAQISGIGGDFAAAMSEVETALEFAPSDSQAWQVKGDLLVTKKELEPALAAYRKALETKPGAIAVHNAIVSLLMQQNRVDEAATQLTAMKKVAPQHPRTLYLQALVAYRQKDLTAARQAIQRLRPAEDNPQGLLLGGAIELELKSYAQAEAYLSNAVTQAPKHQGARAMLINSYLRSGQPHKALDALKPVLESIGKDGRMLSLAGQVFMANGQLNTAADYFAMAAALDPADDRKRAAAAVTRMATGDWDGGLRDAEQAAAASETGIRADLAVIAAHSRRGHYDKALTSIARLEKKQPNSPMPHNLRGAALVAKRDLAGARRSFERALEIDPTYFPAAARLAELELADKKPEAATQRFEALLAKDPKHMHALVALANLRAQAAHQAQKPGSSAGAPRYEADERVVSLLTKAISAHPTQPTPRLALIGYYMRINDVRKAVAVAQQALTALPEQPEILDAAGGAYAAAGETVQALAAFNKLASVLRTSPQPYLRMAGMHLQAKNKGEAMNSLRKALEIKPDALEAQRGMIALELEAARPREAIAIARQVQKQRPNESIGYALEGDVHASQKDWAHAAQSYRAGLAKVKSTDLGIALYNALLGSNSAEAERFAGSWLKENVNDIQFRVHLAQVASIRRDHARAVQHYRAVLESRPNDALILNNLAFSEGQLKDPKALEHAEKANELAPNHPAIMDTLGAILVERGETARGLDLMQKASAMAPQAPTLRLNFAKALISAGQKDAARKELDALSKLGDKFPAQAEVAQLKGGL